MPSFFLGTIFVLLLLQSILASLVPDLKIVLTPALVRARFVQFHTNLAVTGFFTPTRRFQNDISQPLVMIFEF